MKLIERVARAIDPNSWAVMDGYLKDMLRKYKGQNCAYDPEQFKHKPSIAIAKAAIRAMLDGVEPVAFLFEHKEVGVEFSFDPLEQIGITAGWTETPLYSLDVLKEALDHD